MEDTNKVLQSCIERLLLDFADTHGFLNWRKAEVMLFIAAIIMTIARHKNIPMKDIACMFNVGNSTVTDYIDYLESKGFVRRTRGEKDRREVYIELTDKGKSWILQNKQITHDYLGERLSRLSPAEREAFISLLVKFMGIEEPLRASIDKDGNAGLVI